MHRCGKYNNLKGFIGLMLSSIMICLRATFAHRLKAIRKNCLTCLQLTMNLVFLTPTLMPEMP